jgi:hypothetical protein
MVTMVVIVFIIPQGLPGHAFAPAKSNAICWRLLLLQILVRTSNANKGTFDSIVSLLLGFSAVLRRIVFWDKTFYAAYIHVD